MRTVQGKTVKANETVSELALVVEAVGARHSLCARSNLNPKPLRLQGHLWLWQPDESCAVGLNRTAYVCHCNLIIQQTIDTHIHIHRHCG
jgi:hypothetical protein